VYELQLLDFTFPIVAMPSMSLKDDIMPIPADSTVNSQCGDNHQMVMMQLMHAVHVQKRGKKIRKVITHSLQLITDYALRIII